MDRSVMVCNAAATDDGDSGPAMDGDIRQLDTETLRLSHNRCQVGMGFCYGHGCCVLSLVR